MVYSGPLQSHDTHPLPLSMAELLMQIQEQTGGMIDYVEVKERMTTNFELNKQPFLYQSKFTRSYWNWKNSEPVKVYMNNLWKLAMHAWPTRRGDWMNRSGPSCCCPYLERGKRPGRAAPLCTPLHPSPLSQLTRTTLQCDLQ